MLMMMVTSGLTKQVKEKIRGEMILHLEVTF